MKARAGFTLLFLMWLVWLGARGQEVTNSFGVPRLAIIASGLDLPGPVVSDGQNVYWADAGGIKKTSIEGGGPIAVLTDTYTSDNICVDETDVYFDNSLSIYKVSVNGGRPVQLAVNVDVRDLRISWDSVYWTENAGLFMPDFVNAFRMVPKTGGDVRTLSQTGFEGPLALHPWDWYAYFGVDRYEGPFAPDSHHIYRLSVMNPGERVTDFATDASTVRLIDQYFGEIYWVNKDGELQMKTDSGGVPKTTLYQSTGTILQILVGATTLFWLERDADGGTWLKGVYRKQPGEMFDLSKGPRMAMKGDFNYVTVDDNYVIATMHGSRWWDFALLYWAENPDATIVKFPKQWWLSPRLEEQVRIMEAPLVPLEFGNAPEKESTVKDSLVLITHGLQPWWQPVDIAWIDEMAAAIEQRLAGQGIKNWQVSPYTWIDRARDLWNVLDRAEAEGKNLGEKLAAEHWKHIHCIAHSAGAALVNAAADTLKGLDPSVTVHLTFLDPYVGVVYGGKEKYGERADWADDYFTHDFETSAELFSFTETPLWNAYNVEVTWLDPYKVRFTSSTYSLFSYQTTICEHTSSSHGWPIQFYLNTVRNQEPDSQGFGFPLSKEGGGWATATSRLFTPSSAVKVLGTPDVPCKEPPRNESTPVYSSADFNGLVFATSSTGTKEFSGGSLKLTTDSPVWAMAEVRLTNSANLLSFEAAFTSAPRASGLLSVHWGTNILARLEESNSPSGFSRYQFTIPYASSNEVRLLGFRLDPLTAASSSVTVTNITLGSMERGGTFSLSFLGFNKGSAILKLMGPFKRTTYLVEGSSDLVHWAPVSLFDNDYEKVMLIADLTVTNAPRRFYRAIVP